jgi:NADH:ubiquinone oxidoreductase subunit F (NADH-binding)
VSAHESVANYSPARARDRDALVARGAPGLPRLLAGIPPRGALPLEQHLALHGPLPSLGRRGSGRALVGARRGARRGDPALIEEVERAGLLGRGGAAFPTAAKLRAVAAASRSAIGRARPLVVVNGAEGEPASAKDRALLRSLPHLVLDGALLAARAVGAREIQLGICESAPTALDAVSCALAEHARVRGGGADGIEMVLRPVPPRYVAGQESALVNHLSGGPALPTFTPPRPFERGVRGRPTFVCNVETLAHLALIARHGADWFRELGTPEQPGSALVTLRGPLPHPGVYEIEHGSLLTALLDAAGGLAAAPRAVLLGGYAGAWIDGSWLSELVLSDAHLEPYGASLGAGVVAVLSADACPVAELARLTRWLSSQSARQCGPCIFGLDAIATAFEQLALAGVAARGSVRNVRVSGSAGRDAHRTADASHGRAAIDRRLRALAGLVRGRGACGHPDGVARLVESALEVFAPELDEHARRGPCTACARPSELPAPKATPTPVPRAAAPIPPSR